jgi:gluconolactonase
MTISNIDSHGSCFLALVITCLVAPAMSAPAKPTVVDSGFEIKSDAFARVVEGTKLRRLASRMRFTEGPVWYGREACLVFSDIPSNRLHAWDEKEGLRVWREPSHNANGNTLDRKGNLVTCEHGSRRVTRTSADGTVSVLAESYDGKRLNSPNDAAVQKDGTIWFTDPPYGLRGKPQDLPGQYVFRLDTDGELTVASKVFRKPNGICFSPDEDVLYVADSDRERHHVRHFKVGPDKALSGGEVLIDIRPGVPDGMRMDTDGRLYVTAGDGVWVVAPSGKLLGKILVPESPANCAFGGTDRRTLFITARKSLYAITLNATGM